MIDALRSLFPAVELEPGASIDQPSDPRAGGEPRRGLPRAARSARSSDSFSWPISPQSTGGRAQPRFEVVYHLSSMTQRLRAQSLGRRAVAAPADGAERVAGRGLARARNVGHVRHHLRGARRSAQAADARRVGRVSAAEGFPVQIRLRPRSGQPLQVTEEEFRANLARDKAARADAPRKEPARDGRRRRDRRSRRMLREAARLHERAAGESVGGGRWRPPT